MFSTRISCSRKFVSIQSSYVVSYSNHFNHVDINANNSPLWHSWQQILVKTKKNVLLFVATLPLWHQWKRVIGLSLSLWYLFSQVLLYLFLVVTCIHHHSIFSPYHQWPLFVALSTQLLHLLFLSCSCWHCYTYSMPTHLQVMILVSSSLLRIQL